MTTNNTQDEMHKEFEDGCNDSKKEAEFLAYYLTRFPAIAAITSDILQKAWESKNLESHSIGAYDDKINFFLRRIPGWIKITAEYNTVYDYCPINYPVDPFGPEKNVAVYVEQIAIGSNNVWFITDLGESNYRKNEIKIAPEKDFFLACITLIKNVFKIDIATDDTVANAVCNMLLSSYQSARIKK